MDNALFTKIDEVNPKFNPRLANGIVVDFMKNVKNFDDLKIFFLKPIFIVMSINNLVYS